MATQRLIYYAIACLLSVIILADVMPWLIWQFTPLVSVVVDV